MQATVRKEMQDCLETDGTGKVIGVKKGANIAMLERILKIVKTERMEIRNAPKTSEENGITDEDMAMIELLKANL